MKKAIVVGASSGIGFEVARLFIAQGWQVGVAARRQAPLYALQQLAPSRVFTVSIDVTQAEAPNQLLGLIEQLGGVDLYFHAAGVGKQNALLCEDIELGTLHTNATGFVRMVGAAFRYMEHHGSGHIAVISSIAGTKGLGPAPAYSATKALQSTYVEALEQLAVNRGLPIRFTDIRPGFVDTDLLSGGHYPLLMQPGRVAQRILRAIQCKKHVCIIDGRYRVLVFFWRCVPRFLWRRLPLVGRTQSPSGEQKL